MGIKILSALAIIFVFLSGCGFIENYTPDNPTEQFIEKVIEKQTGIQVDLSPWEVKDEEASKSANLEENSLHRDHLCVLVHPQSHF